MSPRFSRLVTLLGGVVGAILFAYAVDRAGTAEIVDGIRGVGWGFLAILALAGLRFMVRAECWRLCVPPSTRLTRRQAFTAFLAGDAVGNVTPLGLLASEPAKVFLTRHHLATRESVSSLAVENLVYGASVIAMVGMGIAVLLATVPLPRPWFLAGIGAICALVVGSFVVARLLRGTWDHGRGERPPWRQRLAGVRVAILGFSGDYGARLRRVFALDLCFHALAVLETFITLQWLLGDRVVMFTQAVVFEALNRIVTVAFKFVPFRIGVDEALSGALAAVLAIDPAAGVALAVVRKIRNLFWSGIGLAIVAAHPARAAAPVAPTGHGVTETRRETG
ncbi:MAG TPA: lysylphosphatidylglycerol synthase transmembrane domain-containing protein, partial [Vicinamibacterales bacterium]